MGVFYSSDQKPAIPTQDQKIENIKKLFENRLADSNDLLDTLNISDFKTKLPLPIIGGGDDELEHVNRYNKYDIFKLISKLDSNGQRGGNDDEMNNESNTDSNYKTISSDNEAMNHIKNIINAELENLNN